MTVTERPPAATVPRRRAARSSDGGDGVADRVEEAAKSDTGDRVVRILGVVGWTTRGLVYLIVAGIVVKVAWSGGSEPQTPTKAGVLNTLVDRTGGLVLVALLAVGSIAYVLVRVAPLVLSRTSSSWQQLGQAAAAVLIYVPLAYSAVRLIAGRPAHGGPASNEQQTNSIGQSLLERDWGGTVLLVGACVLLGYGGYQLYKGVSGRFLRRLDLTDVRLPADLVRALGTAGFVTRGVISGLLGAFALWAARSGDATSVHSIDGLLRSVLGWTFGPVLLTAIGAGLVGFAAYCWCAAAARPHEDG